MKAAVALLVLLCSTAVFAGGIDIVLVAPPDPPRAGETMVFSILFTNAGELPVPLDLPQEIICRLTIGDQVIEVPAVSVRSSFEQAAAIAAKGFVKARYEVQIPHTLEGPVRMQIPAFPPAAGVMFTVKAALPALPQKTEAAAAVSKTAESFDTLNALYQTYQRNISAYQPMYFLVGTDPEKSKFQVSFKYRFFDSENPLAQRYPWVSGFHFGYTQTSFWDLKSSSAPFEDTSYKPELLFLSPNIDTGISWLRGLFLQTGFQHESNGRDGNSSRSTNHLYAQPMFIFYDPTSRLGLQVAPKVWTYLFNEDHSNPDLNDYRGYFDLELKVGKAHSFVLGSHLRWAQKGVSVQADFTYPLHLLFLRNFDLYFQAQYVNALAESLLDYKNRTEQLRLGFAIVR